jgi:hypothetical protein
LPRNSTTREPAATRGPSADDPHDVRTWIAKLDDPNEVENAVSQLEALGDPRAIEPLSALWLNSGRPVRVLEVIIQLARPLTPEEATEASVTAYETSGRPASWSAALPILIRALTEVADPDSMDNAFWAAYALGEAKAGLDALISVTRLPTKYYFRLQIHAIRALSSFDGERDKAAAALVALLTRPALTATEEDDRVTREAINALGELHATSAADALVVAMYRMPKLLPQLRRALVAIGPAAKPALLQAMRGTHVEVNAQLAANNLYPAVVLGDLLDPSVVPDLLAVLKRNTHHVVFDALRKLGAPEAAAPLRALWADAKADVLTRAHAIRAYAYSARDVAGVAQLGTIAADNTADEELRVEAATAYARLARDADGIALMEKLAARYLDASAKKAKQAEAKRSDVVAAYAQLKAARSTVEAERAKFADTLEETREERWFESDDDLHAQTTALGKVEAAYKEAVRKHKKAYAPFEVLDDAARTYNRSARSFQVNIARIEIAARCKQDAACFADSLRASPDDVAARNAPYLKDLAAWTPDDKRELANAAIDRAMLELGKQGAAAAPHTDALLHAVTTDYDDVRQAIVLALPHIAPLPCDTCVQRLHDANDVDTVALRNYFVRARP